MIVEGAERSTSERQDQLGMGDDHPRWDIACDVESQERSSGEARQGVAGEDALVKSIAETGTLRSFVDRVVLIRVEAACLC